jgi:hypothetical protein
MVMLFADMFDDVPGRAGGWGWWPDMLDGSMDGYWWKSKPLTFRW